MNGERRHSIGDFFLYKVLVVTATLVGVVFVCWLVLVRKDDTSFPSTDTDRAALREIMETGPWTAAAWEALALVSNN